MRLPLSLPANLQGYRSNNEEELLLKLIRNPPDLVKFFKAACEDQVWCMQHPFFTSNFLEWLTQKAFEIKISIYLADEAARQIRDNFSTFASFLPKNLTCHLSDKSVKLNSLLFQTASSFWYDFIRIECFEKNKLEFSYPELNFFNFRYLEEFVYTGDVKELWMLEQRQVLPLLRQGRACKLDKLSLKCEELLLRYIDRHNYLEFLNLAAIENLPLVRNKCCYIANSLQEWVKLKAEPPDYLVCELHYAIEASIRELSKYQPYLTHFIAAGQVVEDPSLIALLKNCPKLFSLDIGKIEGYCHNILELHIKELILTGCPWLKDSHLKYFCLNFTHLEKLDLAGCSSITATGWGELAKLPFLSNLVLGNNENLDDAQFDLILTSARHLEDLNITGCRNLTGTSFQALASARQKFISLALARTNVSDTHLLQILSRLPSLRTLDLTRCSNLTEQGIVNALKISPYLSLKEINLSQLDISSEVLNSIIMSYTSLKIIY